MNINEKLRYRRKELNLTMLEVANKVGVSEATVSRWESGKIASLKGYKIIALADALDISIDYLLDNNNINTAENINNSVVLQGNTGNNTISNGATAADANPNSELEDEVLRVFRQLDMRAKNKALTFLYDLEESERS